MMEQDENDTRWTEEARESFRTAAANLVEAVRRHSAVLLELPGTDPAAVEEAMAEADELLETAASAYADAQFELSGTVPPLGLDEEDEFSYEYLEDGDPEPVLADAGEPDLKLTVLHRADFVVTDESAVIQAGKETYHETWDPADEPVDVSDLGEALQQLRQAGGIDALAEAPGVVSAGATTWILEATELLDERDPDEWPNPPFTPGDDVQRRLLLRVDEVAD